MGGGGGFGGLIGATAGLLGLAIVVDVAGKAIGAADKVKDKANKGGDKIKW